jgi:prepilin-type N-terminal cleavage/methylation domain-containing protein
VLSSFRQDERGFTLVELLVVILVIGILLAIILPTFNAQRVKAQDAEAKAAASLVTTALIVYHHDHETFATADEDALAAIEPAIRDVPSFGIDAGVDRFELSVESPAGAAGGGPFLVEHDEGATAHRCTVPGKGGCPDSGLW